MTKWIHLSGYSKQILAEETDLALKGTQIQLARFKKGKHKHYHKRKSEFFYFLKGEGKVIIDGKEKLMKPGMSLLIKPNMVHDFIRTSSEPWEAIMFKTNSSADDTFTK